MAHTISFQHYIPGTDAPRAGYEISDAEFTLPDGMPVPRVGEFFQIVLLDSTETYEVLAITHRLTALGETEPGFHSVVTVGPVIGEEKQKLSWIRE